jgi:hypothetical protein
LLAKVCIWALGRETISCNSICDTFHVGWNRASKLLKRLFSFGIVGDMYEKLPRAILPVEFEDLSGEALDFLNDHDYCDKYVRDILCGKNKANDCASPNEGLSATESAGYQSIRSARAKYATDLQGIRREVNKRPPTKVKGLNIRGLTHAPVKTVALQVRPKPCNKNESSHNKRGEE